MEIAINRLETVQTIRTAKRVNIIAILLTLCSRVWKTVIFPIIDFLADVIFFPLKLVLMDLRITLLFLFMCAFGFFILVNLTESIRLMSW